MFDEARGEDAVLNRARVCYELGRLYERRGGSENLNIALSWQEKGLDTLPVAPTPETALLHALGGIVTIRQANYTQAAHHLGRALSLAEQLNALTELRLVHSLFSQVRRAQGRLDEAMAHSQRSIALAESLADHASLAIDTTNLGVCAFESDDWSLARDAYLKAIAALEHVGEKYQLALVQCNLADLHCHLGEITEGLTAAQSGLTLFTAVNSAQGIMFAHTVLATLYWRQQAFAQAQEQLDQARKLEKQHQIDWFRPTLGRWAAEVALATGDIRLAETELDALLGMDVDAMDEETEPVQRLRAETLAAQGDRAGAVQVLEASLARLEEKGARYQSGEARLALARILLQDKECVMEAKAYVKQAWDIFSALGATLDVQAAERVFEQLKSQSNFINHSRLC